MAQPEVTDIDLTQYTDQLNEALAKGMAAQVATQDPDSYPDIAYKGSVGVFDKDHLFWWERSLGEQARDVEKNPGVVINYRNAETRVQLRFYGKAEIHKDGAVRDQIMSKTVQRELDQDPERKGWGILVKVDRVRQGRNLIQQRKGA
jgi:hypothetical protein